MMSFSSGPSSGVSNSAVSFSWFTSDKLYTESTFFLSDVFFVAFWFGRAFLEALRYFLRVWSIPFLWFLCMVQRQTFGQVFLGCFEALGAIDLFDNNTWLRLYGSVFPFPPLSPVPSITPVHLFLYVSFRPSTKHLGMLSSWDLKGLH